MKCIVYLRVSTKEQALTNEKEGYSIAAQRKACGRYAEEKGWEVVDEYVDRGESARSANRPQLQMMLSCVKKEKDIDFVVVHKIDRLARNLEDHVAIKAILTKAGCSLTSVVENIEDSASGKLVEGIHAIVAEFYSANLATEVKKGMDEKAKDGGWPSRAPVGYKNIRQEIVGAKRGIAKVVIDPETAPHVKEAFNLYSTGNYSIEDIRDFLYDKGVNHRRGGDGRMAQSSVNKLLMNPFYTGVINYKGIEYPGQHKPLITRELFDRVQKMIRSRDVAGERTRKHPHYLKGTLFCAECGSRLSVDKAKGHTYFYCIGQKKRKGCNQPYIKAEELEKEIEKLYEDIQLTQKAADRLIQRFNDQIVSGQSNNALEEQFLGKRIAKLASEKLKLMEAYYAGAVPLDVLKTEQQRIAAEVASSQARLKKINVNLGQHTDVLEKAIRIAKSCGLGYTKAKPNNRRLFNQAFFEKIYVKDKELYKGEFTDLFGALLSKGSNKSDLVEDRGFEPLTFWLPANK